MGEAQTLQIDQVTQFGLDHPTELIVSETKNLKIR